MRRRRVEEAKRRRKHASDVLKIVARMGLAPPLMTVAPFTVILGPL